MRGRGRFGVSVIGLATLLVGGALGPTLAACAGDGAPEGDERWFAADPALRAKVASEAGAASVEDAASSAPLLLEALDDEDASVRTAALTSIVALRSKAVPGVLADIAARPAKEPKERGDPLDIWEMVGGVPTTFARGMAPSPRSEEPLTPTTFSRTVMCAAALPQSGGLPSWSRRTVARMLAVEAGARTGPERATLARALAIVAGEEATAVAGAAAIRAPRASAAETSRLSSLLAGSDPERAMFAAGLVARTGFGGDAVVPELARRARQSPVSVENHLERLNDPLRTGAVQAVYALAALSASSAAARDALGGIPDEAITDLAQRLPVHLRRFVPWSTWLDRASEDDRVRIALEAAYAAAADERLVPLLKDHLGERSAPGSPPVAPGFEAFEWGMRSSRAWYADALGRLGPRARDAVPALEALLDATKGRSVAPPLVAGALLRLGGNRAAALAALLDALKPRPPKEDRLDTRARSGLREFAMEALADAGGADALAPATALLDPMLARSKDLVVGDATTAEHAIRALSHATGEDRATASALLARVLSAPFPCDDDDGSAASILKTGDEREIGYHMRAAALDALASLGPAARPRADAIRSLLSSSDVRVRSRAARALRRLGA